MGDSELLVDFVFDGETVTVPSCAALDCFSSHGCVAGDDVFDGSSEDVAVVRKTGGEGWSIVECVFLFMIRVTRLQVRADD